MKRNIPLYTILICLTFSAFTACKKSGSGGNSNTDLLTKDTWIYSSATVSGVDVSSQIPDCYKDNTADFFSDGTGTTEEGGNICSPSTATIFGWNFQNNETELSMTTNLIPGGNGTFKIEELTATKLTLSQETTLIPSPTPLTIVITFVHP